VTYQGGYTLTTNGAWESRSNDLFEWAPITAYTATNEYPIMQTYLNAAETETLAIKAQNNEICYDTLNGGSDLFSLYAQTTTATMTISATIFVSQFF
jgi:hypothetical protein